MKNIELSLIFNEMYYMLNTDEKARFEALAYQRAARSIESMQDDISEIYEKSGINGLMKIPGIGKGLAEHIEEYLTTGRIKKYDELKKRFPIDFNEFSGIEGFGPKKAMILYEKLGIKNISDLKKAAEEHKIRDIPGFGEKSEALILKNISMVAATGSRILLGTGLNEARKIVTYLLSQKSVSRCEIAGSTRRMRETVGDIDILVTSEQPGKVMDLFIKYGGVKSTVVRGETKTTVLLDIGTTCDLRVIKLESFGSALQYFTGSKDHNIKVRKIAIDHNYKLNEYGLYSGDKNIVEGKDEIAIYEELGMDYIPPEMREDRGEIDLALSHKIPSLIELPDIKGDLHLHTRESDGMNTTDEMIAAAMKKNYEYMAITNHSKSLRVAHGMNDEQFIEYFKKIDRISSKYNIKILKGGEVDILKDGSLDLKDDTLKEMDVVIASVHLDTSMNTEDITDRVINAVKTNMVNVLGHPTGKLINKREAFQINLDEVAKYCSKYKTAMEINASPERLDLNDENILRTSRYGISYSINTDSHNIYGYDNMELGVGTARRGWLTKNNVINTMNLKDLIKFLEK
ncbi:MAG: DNA polymerase/3'-5' exonuclease PolX [Ferroplasma sp.]|uniref:DNA polymerase/3'-5' exonuclease PolX n=1 Tax=Ferroplasma sp. TaxID=2591003 RepID=UPI00281517FA|nr:DNA polymerase/3'-5' exonuclease PolX [Ferroplasma sp.]WMT50456.1 MAG: DNA polymerase/3'-5' exonuclease PolX [Ferroplasma sp.]